MKTITKRILINPTTVIIITSLLIRLLLISFLPIDSDEITWSIIGKRVLSGEDFHIFFLGQKYMGAVEGYIVGIFQAIFGYNTITLRINSIIFSTLLAVLIYNILKKYYSKYLAFFSSLAFLLLAPFDTTFNFTKAWGNVPFISLIGLLSVYLGYKTYLKKTKERNLIMLSVINGTLLGLGFWANLQTFYFVLINIIILLISVLKSKIPVQRTVALWAKKLKVNVNLEFIISIIFYLLLLVLFFMLVTKKSLLNPYLTFSTKFGLNGLKFLNYNFEPMDFLVMLYLIGPIKLIFFPSKNTVFRNFLITMFMFFVGGYFSISRISVARSAGEAVTYVETGDFFFKVVLPKLLGYETIVKEFPKRIILLTSLFLPPILVILTALKRSFATLIKERKVSPTFMDILTLYALIPVFFILSRPSGINASSRYVTSLWPGFIILYSYGIYLLIKKRNLIIKLFALILLTFYISTFPTNLLKLDKYIIKPETNDQLAAAEFLMQKNIKNCYAGYWNAYPIMFESKYKVICSPSEYFGYGENETPFNTEIVDKDSNPAFVFTTQKRVDEFFTKWAGKDVQVLESEVIGKYYIFLTERINQ